MNIQQRHTASNQKSIEPVNPPTEVVDVVTYYGDGIAQRRDHGPKGKRDYLCLGRPTIGAEGWFTWGAWDCTVNMPVPSVGCLSQTRPIWDCHGTAEKRPGVVTGGSMGHIWQSMECLGIRDV